ncbi:MAG: cellulose synthase catalytic subunit [Neorhizobium sp.]|nr:cellulose synthase catalytic subunit [Neorhizobium sp.]
MSPEILTFSDAVLFALAAIALIGACAWLLDARRAQDRILFGSIIILMLVNYLYYRMAHTLPEFHWTPYALWPRIYLSFEIVIIIYTVLSIVFFFRRTDHTAAADASEMMMTAGYRVPAVDVFICTYNEDISILERTVLAAKEIDYPNFTVWILDDGRRDWLATYCSDVGIRYISRSDNKGAKGGNINNAIRHTADETNAPFILILDADFAPQQGILKRTVGQFTDSGIGLIQTPQFYYNSDPIQHNLLVSKAWVDDQRIFFDVMQPSKDGWGAAFCVGTSCIVRRDALEMIGGMPEETVTEDIHLTYRLMQAGLKTRWLNERLSVGLSAESLSGYITQRCRWCLGTIQVALLEDGPFRGRGYTLMQRLHYFHGLLFWFCRPFMLLMMAAPILYYFLGLPAILMEPEAFFLFALPMVGGMWIFHSWVSHGRSLPILTEVSQMVSAIPITIAIIHALMHPFGRPFKVTAKGEDRTRVAILYPIAATFLAVIVLTFIGMLNGPLLRTYNDLDGFSLAWGMVVMIYAFVSMIACIELPREPIEAIQFPIDQSLTIGWNGDRITSRLESMSVNDAILSATEAHMRDTLAIGDLIIYSPFTDLDIAARVTAIEPSGSRYTVGNVAVREANRQNEISRDPVTVRSTIIGHLFSQLPETVPATASASLAVKGLAKRMFDRPTAVMGQVEGSEFGLHDASPITVPALPTAARPSTLVRAVRGLPAIHAAVRHHHGALASSMPQFRRQRPVERRLEPQANG